MTRRDETIARALDSGVADYIVKPFSPTELTARVRAALRRWSEPDPFVLGELTIDLDRREVTLAGWSLELTGDRIQSAAHALTQRRSGSDLRNAAAPGLGRAQIRRAETGAGLHQETAAQAR